MYKDLLEKELSRREFLNYVGVTMLALVGITGLLSTLRNSSTGLPGISKGNSLGYGSGVYGGKRKEG